MSGGRHVVVGTAGHIDHGKTSLVKALTGIDTDRLPEEKARGITIDLGFAFLEEPDGLTIEIVDVPGHERFVKNMLAGVGGIDLAMLVIAADEGVMPQTREHLAICSLLRIKSGPGRADQDRPGRAGLARAGARGRRARCSRGTFLAGAPIVPVSSKTGAGAGRAARRARATLARAVPPRGTDQLPRLPIDRVFTIKGFGTVVTGTLTAGRLRGRRPGRGLSARARRPRCAGCRCTATPVTEAQRRASAPRSTCQGVERAAIERGDVVGLAGTLVPSVLVDGTLELLGRCAAAAEDARPRALPRRHAAR